MLNAFYKTHDYLVEHVQVPARRVLMDEINWNDRLIAIKGGRGTGKTDFLLNYAKELRVKNPELAKHMLYINLSDFYFTEHTLVELAAEFVAGGGLVLLIDKLTSILIGLANSVNATIVILICISFLRLRR